MGRFTAYDQNGRMVADFDKGDYDFLCSYGRTPEEVLDENAKLRKENDTLCRRIDELCMENEQLRELVWDMWHFTGAACKKYPRLFDPSAQGGQMVQLNAIDAFEQRMYELGIEVYNA